jgi:hypothetical protein
MDAKCLAIARRYNGFALSYYLATAHPACGVYFGLLQQVTETIRKECTTKRNWSGIPILTLRQFCD